jgi:hypothetical protein
VSFPVSSADTWSDNARRNSIIVIITFIFIGWFSFKDIRMMLTAGSWFETQAMITQSTINRGTRAGPDSPYIEYRYEVNGQSYVGNEIDFGQWNYDIPTYLAKYPTGRIVKIYYDPVSPKRAVLEKSGSYILNAFMLFLTWGGALLLGYYRFLK